MAKRNPWTVADRHRLRIAKDTLRLTDAADGLLGGPTKAEARQTLTSFGWSAKEIARLEHG